MKQSENPHDSNSSSRYGFEMFFKEDGKYYFQLNDTKGVPLLFSKSYSSEKSCAKGIQAIIHAAGNDERYDLKETGKGEYFFILKAGNNREIGRSRLFDRLEELEDQMEFLKGIDEDVPQYDVMDTLAETVDEVPEEKGEVAESLGEEKKTPEVAEVPPSQPEGTNEMARYKFSVIYYPDSKIWTVKNDFSGGSIKLKTYDGQQIEDFLRAQLPPEEREALQPTVQPETIVIKEASASPQAPVREVPTAQPSAVQPAEPVKKKTSVQAQKSILEEIEINIRTYQGALIKGLAEKSILAKVEIILKVSEDAQPAVFDARVMAKSVQDKQVAVIGAVKNQGLVNGRLEIPIHGANNLKKGPHRFTVEINQIKQGKESSAYYGSKLVVLN